MLKLMLVETEQERQITSSNTSSATLNHGTEVSLNLVSPWLHTNRLVCADSYFSSVATASLLYQNGLRFTGIVKTANSKFPIS